MCRKAQCFLLDGMCVSAFKSISEALLFVVIHLPSDLTLPFLCDVISFIYPEVVNARSVLWNWITC